MIYYNINVDSLPGSVEKHFIPHLNIFEKGLNSKNSLRKTQLKTLLYVNNTAKSGLFNSGSEAAMPGFL